MSDTFPIFYGRETCRRRLQEIADSKEPSGLREQEEAVRAIIDAVRIEGDAALVRYTRQFDGIEITPRKLRVAPESFTAARSQVTPAFLKAIEHAARRVEGYHQKQLPRSWIDYADDGIAVGQKVTPLRRVGVYVPGGRANYPSTVLMTAIPARVAGVEEVSLACPPSPSGEINPHVLVAAEAAGVEEVYRVGGAQAIAAMAWGTETIPRVDKIVGPGNIYVVLAKKLLFGRVGIESLPGPSEVAIVADESARALYVAADLMAQSEHGPDSCSLLITTSSALGESVAAAIEKALSTSRRAEHIRQSLGRFGGALVVDSLEETFDLLNEAAPEHAQLLLANPWEHVHRVKNAGAIFIGEHSPVPLGDYLAGPSHVLPTATTARFSSGLNVEDFVKRSSLVSLSQAGAASLAEDLAVLAEVEDLPAHYQAVRVRLQQA